jgi:DNA-directed RNA polymerase specialized sigma24 family protein
VDATADTSDDELELIAALRKGDEDAFMSLVERLQPVMLRVSRMYVSSQEVVQEAWLGVPQGIDRFEGRSSLRTWILRIVGNIAKTTGHREGRSVPFASLGGDDLDAPTFDPDRFLGPSEERAGSLVDDAGGLERRTRRAPDGVGDARRRAGRDRATTADAGRGDPSARRDGLVIGRSA